MASSNAPQPATDAPEPAKLKGFDAAPRRMKTAEAVARQLVTYIAEDALAEGTRLPAEREMLAEIGVGRNTLREALRLLEMRGVISIRSGPRGGPVVRHPRAEDLSEPLTLILQFGGGVLHDVVEAREVLECCVVDRATSRLSSEQRAQLRETVELARARRDDPELFFEQTQLFHEIINDACASLVLLIFNRALHEVTNAAVERLSHTVEHREAVIQAHERILTALDAGDAPAAVEAMRSHVRESGEYWGEISTDPAQAPVRWLPTPA